MEAERGQKDEIEVTSTERETQRGKEEMNSKEKGSGGIKRKQF